MGITKRDLKILQQTSSRKFRLASIMGIGLAIVVFLAGAVNDVRLCNAFADMAGLTLAQACALWIKGVPASQSSLQIVLLATQRLQMALISLAVVAALAVALWALLATANRNVRILESLKVKKR